MPVTCVMAVSLDGAIASHAEEADDDRASLGFTNEDDRRHLLELLARADAVVVGRKSLLASGGALETPPTNGRQPLWVVLTNQGLPADHRFWTQTAVERWVASRAPLPAPPRAAGPLRNLTYGERSAATAILSALGAASRHDVLLFGGGEVNREFFSQGLVDRVIVTLCPIILGSSAARPLVCPPLPAPARLELVASQPCGDLVFLTYNVRKH